MTHYITMLTNDPLSILGLSGIGLLVWAGFDFFNPRNKDA